ncbi:hypothetical protein TRVA0_004S03422 [Trichomonascus vanleenenianus]|uniref:uncharacterized protein n=1 Tax=Trichomonascus vanleenenianus TaxID=2268995 RepID=UPI003ECA84CA
MNIDQILNSTGRNSADSNVGDEDQGDDTKSSGKTPNSDESSNSLGEKEVKQDQPDMMKEEKENAEMAHQPACSLSKMQLSHTQEKSAQVSPRFKEATTSIVSPTKRARSASATTPKEMASLSTLEQLHRQQLPPQLAPLAQSFQAPTTQPTPPLPRPPPPPPPPPPSSALTAAPSLPPPLQTYQSVSHLPQYFQYSPFHPYHTHQQLPVPQQSLAQSISFPAHPPPPPAAEKAIATQQQHPSPIMHYPEYYYNAGRMLPISAPTSPATSSLISSAFQPRNTTTTDYPSESSIGAQYENRKGKSKRIKAPNSTWTLEDDAKLVDLVLRTLPRQDYNEYARILNKRDAQTVRYRWKVIVRRAKGYGMLDESQ